MMPTILPRLSPDADEARGLLEEELATPPYTEAEPNIFERILAEILRGITRFLDGLTGLGAGPGTLVLAIGAALIILVAVRLIKPRLNARGSTPDAAVFEEGARRSATQHRSRAEELAGTGNWEAAVAETLRAVIRTAEERLVLDEQPGRTATEAGVQLGGAFPALAADITWLTDLFNETQYGSGRATGEDYRRAAQLDTSASGERPASAGGSPTLAAPR
jgi:hypothetical protein